MKLHHVKAARQQLTTSDFLKRAWDLEDQISALEVDSTATDLDDLQSQVESIADEIRSLGEEQSDKLSNMPDQLQSAPTGELLQNRADSCEEWASNLEGASFDSDLTDDALSEGLDLEDKSPKERQEAITEARQDKIDECLQEVQGFAYEGE